MYETSKSKGFWSDFEFSILKGDGIDIGCGPDPVFPDVKKFDAQDGDANHITRHVKGDFDYVYSSHCLEHMNDASQALAEWWKLVRPGGYLYFTVPDEDLYEQGFFPSIGNSTHKSTFTIYKEESWSPASRNVRDLASALPNGEVVSIDLQDQNYDRSLFRPGRRRPGKFLSFIYFLYLGFNYYLGPKWKGLDLWIARFHPIDQTMRPNTLAQIRCIVRKLPANK